MLKLIKKYKYVITIIVIIIVIVLVLLRTKELKGENDDYLIYEIDNIEQDEIYSSKNDRNTEKIKVDIKGQVNNPGVYELNNNARVIDLINLAGGLTDIANTSLINLSKKLEDQMVIIIYSNEEVINSNIKEIETVFKVVEKECVCPVIKNDSCINTELESNDSNNNDDYNTEKININTASIDELISLPNVGESKAEAIIEYRKDNKFTTIDEIKNVSGIGETLFEKIKEYITV